MGKGRLMMYCVKGDSGCGGARGCHHETGVMRGRGIS